MNKTRKLVLHVGPPKTGTSVLQHTLAANQKWLLGQGVLYPTLSSFNPDPTGRDVGEPTGVKHDYLLLSALSDARNTLVFKRISPDSTEQAALSDRCEAALNSQLESSSAETLLLSSEAFGNTLRNSAQTARELVEFASRLTESLEVVIYVREPVHLARSHQQHLLRSGRSFDEVNIPYRYPYHSVIKRLHATGRINRLHVRPYNRDFDKKFDIVADLSSVIGIDSDLLDRPTFHGNRSLTLESAHLLDALHRRFPASDRLSLGHPDRSSRVSVPLDIGSTPFRLSAEVESHVRKQTRLDSDFLEKHYGISFPEVEIPPSDSLWDHDAIDDLVIHLRDKALREDRLRNQIKRLKSNRTRQEPPARRS